MTAANHSGRIAAESSAFAYLASGWLIGLVCSIVLVTGLALGIGLTPLGIGIPIFFFTLWLARMGARGERVRAALSALMFKELGVGLASAILIDATVVRAVLLPATMKLLGDWNWYLPRRLESLPRIGAMHQSQPEPAR